MSIGLIGYRGCGKTTVGRRLADRLWQPFADTDEMIVRHAGKSIAEIFQQEGEAAFRDLETQAIREASAMSETVISLGGGALDREENRKIISEAGLKLIYLRCEPRELLRRIESDPQTASARPHLTPLSGGIEEIEQVLARREPIWRSLHPAELEVTHLTPQEAVVYCVRLL